MCSNPAQKRLQDNNFLPLDNYLSGVTDSPNIVYAQLVNYLSAINQTYLLHFFYKVALYIFYSSFNSEILFHFN